MGRLSDKFGRKFVLLLSIAGTFSSYLILLISRENLSLLFISRIIIGMVKNTESSCYSMIADISNDSKRSRRISYAGSAIGLGFIIGPTLSSILTQYRLEFPTIISLFLLVANFVIVYTCLPETRNMFEKQMNFHLQDGELKEIIQIDDIDPSIAPVKMDDNKTIFSIFFQASPLRIIFWVILGTTLAQGIFQGGLSIIFQINGLNVQQSSWVMSYTGFLTVISGFVMNHLSSKFEQNQLLKFSMYSMAFSLFLASIPSSKIVILLIDLMPLVLSSKILKSTLLALVTQKSSNSNTATIIGISNSLESFSRALSPLISGFLISFYPNAPAVLGSLIIIFIIIYPLKFLPSFIKK